MKNSQKILRISVLIILLLAMLPAQAVYAGTRTVTNTNDAGAGSLREAISSAASGDTITFSVIGTITLTSGQLIIDKDLNIDGPGASQLTISGNDTSRVFSIESGTTVTLSNLTLSHGRSADGTDGADATTPTENAEDGSPGAPGGAIYNAGALTLSACIIKDNQTGAGGRGGDGVLGEQTSQPGKGGTGGLGGGIYNHIGAELTVENIAFSSNITGVGGDSGGGGDAVNVPFTGGNGGAGGAIYNNGVLAIKTSTFETNATGTGGSQTTASQTAYPGDGGNGGAIYSRGNLSIEDSSFENNKAADGHPYDGGNGTEPAGAGGHGGAIFSSSTLILKRSTLQHNASGASGGGEHDEAGSGGALFLDGTTQIEYSTINNNTAAQDAGGEGGYGGGIYAETSASLNIKNSTVSNNAADGAKGGGIAASGPLTLINSTISGNHADQQGGGIISYDTLHVEHTTIVNNAAGWQGGGVYISSGDTVYYKNSIIVGNTGLENDCSNSAGSLASEGYNIIGSTCTNNGSTDQTKTLTETKLGNLTDNGGYTQTHALLADSPAIDQIPLNTNGCGSDYTIAQRGVPRPDEKNASSCDIGAYEIDDTAPHVISSNRADQNPSSGGTVTFTVTFSENVKNVDSTDFQLTTTGSIAGVTITAVQGEGNTYTVSVKTGSGEGTIRLDVQIGDIVDMAKHALSADFTTGEYYTVNNPTLTVLYNNNTTPNDNAILHESITEIKIEFSAAVKSDASSGAANNENNYILIEQGNNNRFDTLSCSNLVQPDDIVYPITQIDYDDTHGFIATLTVNNNIPLPIGNYRLFICGTTSIEDLNGVKLNNGTADSTLSFSISPTSLPATGFRHGEVMQLAPQPATKAYTATAMLLEIPKLGVFMPIVGVPQSSSSWDVTWLGNSAGYLSGSAFPTWAGNTVLTGHVWDAYNQPGPFAELKSLEYGDQVQIQAWGETYTYEVRESKLLTKKNLNAVFQSEQYDWVTLVTCEFYNPFSGEYLFRRVVRAVLVSVQ